LASVTDTRASCNLKIKPKKQNKNLFAIILPFNKTSLSYPRSPCEPFTLHSLTNQASDVAIQTFGGGQKIMGGQNVWFLANNTIFFGQTSL